MTKVKLLHPVNHDGVWHKAGSTFEADADTIDQLIAAGAVRDPDTPELVEDTSVAEDKAKAIVEQAEKALDQAKADAEKIVATAKDEATKITDQAKADAEKIVATAKDAQAGSNLDLS